MHTVWRCAPMGRWLGLGCHDISRAHSLVALFQVHASLCVHDKVQRTSNDDHRAVDPVRSNALATRTQTRTHAGRHVGVRRASPAFARSDVVPGRGHSPADTIAASRARTLAHSALLPPRSIANLCKDYCGVLTEESIRLNFVLIYELLDEVIDFGYVVPPLPVLTCIPRPHTLCTAARSLLCHWHSVVCESPTCMTHATSHTHTHTHTHTHITDITEVDMRCTRARIRAHPLTHLCTHHRHHRS